MPLICPNKWKSINIGDEMSLQKLEYRTSYFDTMLNHHTIQKFKLLDWWVIQ